MFPTEAFQPWVPLGIGALVLLGVISLAAAFIRNRAVRAVVVIPVVVVAAKLAWDYMLAAGI